MSWQAAHDKVITFVCKVSPAGKICRNYLMTKYPECFKTNKSYARLIMDLPQKIWQRIGPTTHHAMPVADPSVCPVCLDEEQETAILANAFKLLFLLAVSVAILYGILKATALRRPTAQ